MPTQGPRFAAALVTPTMAVGGVCTAQLIAEPPKCKVGDAWEYRERSRRAPRFLSALHSLWRLVLAIPWGCRGQMARYCDGARLGISFGRESQNTCGCWRDKRKIGAMEVVKSTLGADRFALVAAVGDRANH